MIVYSTAPDNEDTDADTLLDADELFIYHTNPLSNDTESDGLPDNYEIQHGLNPIIDDAVEDFDNDNLTNIEEFILGTLPNSNDTDSDGMSDGFEAYYGLFLTENDSKLDPDYDGLYNIEEFQHETNPKNNDTDSDGMLDGYEVSKGLNPKRNDSYEDPDMDELTNIEEMKYGTNPFKQDTDDDSLNDKDEIEIYHTSPIEPDSDNDGLDDGEEVLIYHTNPNKKDTDGDGLNDYAEAKVFLTDPLNPDTDGDGVDDKTEISNGKDPLVKNPYTPMAKFLLVLPYIIGFLTAVATAVLAFFYLSKKKKEKTKKRLTNEVIMLRSELNNLYDRTELLLKTDSDLFHDNRSLVDLTKLIFNFISKFDLKFAEVSKFKDIEKEVWETIAKKTLQTFENYLRLVNKNIEAVDIKQIKSEKLINLTKEDMNKEEIPPEMVKEVHIGGKEMVSFTNMLNKFVTIIGRRLLMLNVLQVLREDILKIKQKSGVEKKLLEMEKEFKDFESEYFEQTKKILHKKPYCLYCGHKLVSLQKACPNCKKIPPRCMVCHDPIKQLEEIYICPACNHVAHKEHLGEWLGERGYCPNCKERIELKVLDVEYA
ncbi:MAG: hypothetical protein ACTSQE_06490 [Candidatus Heimdallarchaeaceae archaeon]